MASFLATLPVPVPLIDLTREKIYVCDFFDLTRNTYCADLTNLQEERGLFSDDSTGNEQTVQKNSSTSNTSSSDDNDSYWPVPRRLKISLTTEKNSDSDEQPFSKKLRSSSNKEEHIVKIVSWGSDCDGSVFSKSY
jgi:hypothetical protein